MKKAAIILLLSIYAISSFGISIKQFYCCGILKSTGIVFTQQEVKEKCNNGKSDCCKTQFKNLKVKDNHVAAGGLKEPVKHFTDLHLFSPSFETITFATEPAEISNPCHAPPVLHHGVSIYILNCTYRI